MSIANNFKENISFALTFRNINHTDLAKLLGTSRRIVSNWFNSEANIPIEMIVGISKELNISVETLLFGDKKDVGNSLSGYLVETKKYQFSEKDQQYESGINNFTPDMIEQLLLNPEFLVQLIRGLTQQHEKLKKDPIYQLFLGRIISDYKLEEVRKEVGESVSSRNKPGYSKS